MKEICRDLHDEQETLDAIVSKLSEEQWDLITPFIGWSIKYEIAHVALLGHDGQTGGLG